MTVVEAFGRTYEDDPAGVWSAPGRVNLIGEHTDYSGGFVLPFAIEARTTVAAARRGDDQLRMRSVQQPTGDISVALADLAPGHPDGWAAYVGGVLWAAREKGCRVGGLDVLVDGRVPPGGGLSSSHAIEVSVALAVNDLFDLRLDTDEIGRLTQVAENDFVGAPTGLMDQFALLRSRPDHALFLDTRSLTFDHVPLDAAGAGLALLVVDTQVHHALGDGAYADRRAACEQAAAHLGVASLRDVPADDLEHRLAGLDAELRRRARHVVTENARVLEAVDALRARDWQKLGRSMDASHESLRQDYEVSCPELDVAVAAARQEGALGARMTGGGFGGSVITLVPAAKAAAVRAGVGAAFAEQDWAAPKVFPVAPSAGAKRDR